MYICVLCVCLVPTEEGTRVPRAGVKDICKLSCRSWELNLDLLQE